MEKGEETFTGKVWIDQTQRRRFLPVMISSAVRWKPGRDELLLLLLLYMLLIEVVLTRIGL